MAKICYIPKKFGTVAAGVIQQANVIIEEYMQQGLNLTLRQLYYQFVARDQFPNAWRMDFRGGKWVYDERGTKNNGPNYTKLQGLISSGRVAGLVDWNAIVDRMRAVEKNSHWLKPSDLMKSASSGYANDKWSNQPHYVEVWVEKDALAGVLSSTCSELDVPFFACRGYTSQTAAWDAAQRLIQKRALGKVVHIIHLGDHDPSGIDMSRDIKERLELFTGEKVHVLRVALNMFQIQRYNPPPNPAKETDSRYDAYRAEYGDLSWELDALPPTVLVDIVKRAVLMYRDEELWAKAVEHEGRGRQTLEAIGQDFEMIVQFLRDKRRNERERGGTSF